MAWGCPMPKLETPSNQGGDTMTNDRMEQLSYFPLCELIGERQRVRFRDAPLRTLHGEETDPQSDSADMLNGSGHFDEVYGLDALPFQFLPGLETFEIVTNVSQYMDSLGARGSREEEADMDSSLVPGSAEGILGQPQQAYTINPLQEKYSSSRSSYTAFTKGGNLSVQTKELSSQETFLLGTARFVQQTPPTMVVASVVQPLSPQTSVVQPLSPQTSVVQPLSPQTSVVQPLSPQTSVVQPLSPQTLGEAGQPHRLPFQRRRRFSSDGHFPAQERELRFLGFQDPVLEDEAFEEGVEQFEGGEFVLPPPAERVLEPAVRCQTRMQRRCSF
ncbi:variable charge X-linked protein 3B-like [Littorina saxatilis]|uniref:variable charge X-linked protein 3B-like n=1 Tax=Littorina saxatilis TaxID=31220 RepID=UPI0038B67565